MKTMFHLRLAGAFLFLLMSHHAQSQPWLDTTLYPFQSQVVDLPAGQMHYVDEGQGDVLLFVHGTPTWSILYRNFIAAFKGSYRCIAVDHMGFGLSPQAASGAQSSQQHAENLSHFIEALDLHNITLVVHDFGGPIGLGAALQHPDRISRIVLFNSWLWSTANDADALKIDKLVHSRLGRFLYLRMNVSPKLLLKKGFHNKKKLSKQLHRQYLGPFPNKQSREALYAIAQSLVGQSDWYEAQCQQLGKLENKPWLILWGAHDAFFTEAHLARWQERFPEAETVRFEAGHFVQEEQPEAAIEAMKGFLKRKEQHATSN